MTTTWLLTVMGSFVIGFYHITLVQVPKSGSKVSHARDEELSASHPSCSRSWEWNPPPEWGSLPRLRKHRDNLGECGRRSCRVNQRQVWCWFRFSHPWWRNPFGFLVEKLSIRQMLGIHGFSISMLIYWRVRFEQKREIVSATVQQKSATKALGSTHW